ncbi:MAG: hypothetical protein ACPHUL_00140 [Marinomonas gallaica]
MIWILSALCMALYFLGAIGMGALALSVRRGKGLPDSQSKTLAFAFAWPWKVMKNLF